MTQPNPGDGTNAAPSNQNPPQGPANGQAATHPTTTTTAPPTPPGFVPATSADTPAEDDQAQRLLATAVAQDQQAAPPGGELGEAGKRAIAAEREARKAAEKQIADLTKQMEALKPAADIFAQLRKAAVPDEEKTDTERLQEQIAKLQQETTTERRQRWVLEIIQEKGLSREDAAWLHGDTRDELEESAEKFAARLAATRPAPQAPPQNSDPPPAGGTAVAPPQPAPTPNGPRPDPSQGARGPVDINAQIQDALAKGDVKTSIALKQQLRLQQQGTQ